MVGEEERSRYMAGGGKRRGIHRVQRNNFIAVDTDIAGTGYPACPSRPLSFHRTLSNRARLQQQNNIQKLDDIFNIVQLSAQNFDKIDSFLVSNVCSPLFL